MSLEVDEASWSPYEGRPKKSAIAKRRVADHGMDGAGAGLAATTGAVAAEAVVAAGRGFRTGPCSAGTTINNAVRKESIVENIRMQKTISPCDAEEHWKHKYCSACAV